jgi:WS/DGAT/MGAT family acyltransferase
MSQAGRGNSLSWGDTFFLYLEREGQPLNVACTCELEGPVSLQDLTKYVASKLDLIPRYKQRAVFPQFNLGLPTWEPDPNFDIRNHIHQVSRKGGTDADLKAVASGIISSILNRNRPLWDLTLVRGLKGNRTGFIFRVHHCLADGVAGVGLMNVLFDTSPTPHKASAAKQQDEAPQLTDSLAQLLDGVLKSYQSFMQGALTAQSEILTIARELLASTTNGRTEELMHLVPELASPSERLPFNQVICHGPQKVAWGEMPMSDIKAIRENFGGTVNDVVLTVITSTVRRYAELHGVKLRGRNLRLMVPVNVRGSGDVSELGNKITFLPINTPLDVSDPRMLLAKVSERMVFLRSIGVQDLVGLVGTLVSKVPHPVQAALVPILTQLPLSLANMICTNVPGPQQPLYLLGHKMLRAYPYVPIGGEMGVNVAILSYNGTAYVGYGGDVHAVPDIDKFEELLRVSFAELHEAAVGTPTQTKVPARKAKVAAPSQPERQVKVKPAATAPPARPKVRLIPTAKPETPKRKVVAAKKAAVPFPPATEVKPAVEQEPLARSGD